MFSNTFPLGVILFQLLFLAVAIAIEAYVFKNRLKIDQKTSVAYATSINLFSTVIGWLMFFLIDPMLPANLRSELISYVLFNRYNSLPQNTGFTTFMLFVLIFFITFIIKFILLLLLQFLLKEPPKEQEKSQPPIGRRVRRYETDESQDRGRATAVLLATASSYLVILLILFIRSFDQKPL